MPAPRRALRRRPPACNRPALALASLLAVLSLAASAHAARGAAPAAAKAPALLPTPLAATRRAGRPPVVASQARAMLAVAAEIDASGALRRGPWGPGGAEGYCGWQGVECDGDGYVTAIAPPPDSLKGALPAAAHLRALPRLRILRLAGELRGTLPAAWGGLPSLVELEVASSAVEGPPPPAWGALRRLESLELSCPGLAGGLPAEWAGMRALRVLRAPYAQGLAGKLPASWSALTNLTELSLWRTSVSGPLPEGWGPALRRLRRVELYRTRITGTLPASWAGMESLEELLLYRARLEGPLPPSWGALRRLRVLEIGENRLRGPVPASWGGMASLRDVSAYNMELGATCLPKQWRGRVSVQPGFSSCGEGARWVADAEAWDAGLGSATACCGSAEMDRLAARAPSPTHGQCVSLLGYYC